MPIFDSFFLVATTKSPFLTITLPDITNLYHFGDKWAEYIPMNRSFKWITMQYHPVRVGEYPNDENLEYFSQCGHDDMVFGMTKPPL